VQRVREREARTNDDGLDLPFTADRLEPAGEVVGGSALGVCARAASLEGDEPLDLLPGVDPARRPWIPFSRAQTRASPVSRPV